MAKGEKDGFSSFESPMGAWWRLYVLLSVVAIATVGMMGYAAVAGRRSAAYYTPLVDAAMEIRLEAVTGYLLFEELLYGEPISDIAGVRRHFDLAEWYVRAMLEGGTNEEGAFFPLREPKLRARVLAVQRMLERFRAITEQRYAVAANLELHREQHGLLAEFSRAADDVESAVQAAIARDLVRFRFTMAGTVVASLAMGLIVGIAFYRFEANRWRHVRELRAARSKAEESEERFRQLVSHAADAFFLSDPAGRVVDVNPAACDTLGYTREELLARAVSDVEVGRSLGELRAVWGRLVPGESATLDGVHRRRDGTTFPVEVRVGIFQWEGGTFVLSLARDVSERKRVEAELEKHRRHLEELVAERTSELRQVNEHLREEIRQREQAEGALRESEERFRTVADFNYDWEYWVGPDGRVRYVSPSCERITGYSPREFQEDPDLYLAIIHPEDRARLGGHVRERSVRGGVHVIDFRIVTKSGEVRWIDHICQPVARGDGQQLGRRGSNRDATARVAEAESLRRVSNALLRKIALEEVLDLVCVEARRLMGAGGSAVYLAEDGECLRRTRGSGTGLPASELMPLELCLPDRIRGDGAVPARAEPLPDAQGEVSRLIAPLRVEGTNIGALLVVDKPQGFGQKDRHLIELFADQAAIAIDNARLRGKAEQVAVMEERQRLARELHDSLTQALYSGALYADAALKALAAGKEDALAAHLREVRALTRAAMIDMRLLVFELRPPALAEEGLAGALRTRLAAVESRAGLRTELAAEGERFIPEPVQTELYRVGQEALNNVVRHSRARHVAVRLGADDSRAWLEVQDDGVGFDAEAAREGGGIGLRSMRERVERAGGLFQIASAPGEGTRLRAEFPNKGGEGDGLTHGRDANPGDGGRRPDHRAKGGPGPHLRDRRH